MTRRLSACVTSLLLCFGLSSPAPAGLRTYELPVAGASMSCVSWRGVPVKVAYDISVQSLGRAYFSRDGLPIIEMNPGALNSFSPVVQQWWFAHECAHHELPPQLNSEKRADCIAARKIRAKVATQAATFRRELRMLLGSETGHLPGEERARLVLKCAGVSMQA